MSVAKLYYFDGRGLAEPLRIIFAVGGVKYEDIRAPLTQIPMELPSEIKQKCTWGQVPVLEFEGRKMAQSLAITRYFARKFNLVGSTELEAAECDEYVDTCRDFLSAWSPLYMEKDEAKLKEKVIEVTKVVNEKYLSKFNEIIKKNGGSRLVGKSLTWADIYLAHVVNNIELIAGLTLTGNFPEIKALMDSVFSVPAIKAWVTKRPKTKF